MLIYSVFINHFLTFKKGSFRVFSGKKVLIEHALEEKCFGACQRSMQQKLLLPWKCVWGIS